MNLDYLKNVFIKYLEYQANSDEKGAMTLEKVLFTVLKANEKDIEIIEKARQKNTGGILSYFYSGAATVVPRPVQPRHFEVNHSVDGVFTEADSFGLHRQAGKLNGQLSTQLPHRH